MKRKSKKKFFCELLKSWKHKSIYPEVSDYDGELNRGGLEQREEFTTQMKCVNINK